jgi:hypothetical protein
MHEPEAGADTKDLCDIPRFWPQAQRLRWPLVEYAAREVRSGLLFWAFAQKRSAATIRSVIAPASPPPSATASISASRPLPTPSRAMSKPCIAWSKDEFFDLESFSSRGEFLAKAQTYQLYFNLARPNSHKENQTPWQIIERLAPRSPLQLCLLPPVFLDYYLNDSGGYDVPSYPSRIEAEVVRYDGD